MRAAQLVSRGRTNIINTPLPEAAEGHALVQPLLLAICGSDLRKVYYFPEDCYPLPPGNSGHEVIARVVSMNHAGGSSGRDTFGYPWGPVKDGDIVLALIPEVENGMAEYMTTEIVNLLPLPPGKPATSLILAQQLGTVIYACRRLPDITGMNVVVVGQGSAGLFFNVMLRRMGAKNIIAFDHSDARLEMGLNFGSTAGFNSKSVDPVEAVVRTFGPQKADLVIEAVGSQETYNLIPRLVKKFGLLMYFGVPHEQKFEIDVMEWYRMCPTSIAIVGASDDPGNKCFIEALELISSGEIEVESMVTHTYDFDEVEKAYEIAHTTEDGAGKVYVKMPEHDKYIEKSFTGK